jgi:hypothetical protein
VRVIVGIEVSWPSLIGFPLDRDHLLTLWIPSKFEKLDSFCYGYGILGYDIRVN